MANKIREEEIKNKVAKLYFQDFDCTKILGDIDFCVSIPNSNQDIFGLQSFLWAEAKSKTETIVTSIVQIILTIGKARTFDTYLPPPFLGSFDAEEIGIIPYNLIHDIFYINDFNWKVPPSDHNTKEFKILLEKVTATLNKDFIIFKFGRDDKELKKYIKSNFMIGKTSQSKVRIDKNNFTVIYNKWLTTVKPTIDIIWNDAKKKGIIDGDFYLADLLSANNESLQDKLFVLLQKDHYILDRKIDEIGLLFRTTQFTDRQKAHNQFWNKYERPPKKEFWDYIVERRDLLVPQDIREKKGSYFTPQIWVELSQKYIAEVLGEDWQDEYYVWDCAAGTGNLLTGLINKYNVWASTLDQPDVDVMHERIETMNNNSLNGKGANLLHDHVFKFDFLNDNFNTLPQPLQDIINDEEKRKKLVIYINPPYVETNAKKGTESGKKIGKAGVNLTIQRDRYEDFLGRGKRELYAQFIVRIYHEIADCKLAVFSKLKILNAPFYQIFRNRFLATLEKLFVVPADTFDNVKGKFPIGFQIWDTSSNNKFEYFDSDVYTIINKNISFSGKKGFYSYDDVKYINDWIIENRHKKELKIIGKIFCVGSDFQHQSYCRLNSQKIPKQAGFTIIDVCIKNIFECCVFYSVRHCIDATWLNDRDQFLYPNISWKDDLEFKSDCLAYALFTNDIKSRYGTNYWIPFTEYEINSREKFESHFMADFIDGKIDIKDTIDLFNNDKGSKKIELDFSIQAKRVFETGREVWKYYHKQKDCNVNASLYDIREHFQGRNEKGKMNNRSTDETYNELIGNLRDDLKILAEKISPKVYQHGFLKPNINLAP